jgi:hypothetical protein
LQLVACGANEMSRAQRRICIIAEASRGVIRYKNNDVAGGVGSEKIAESGGSLRK